MVRAENIQRVLSFDEPNLVRYTCCDTITLRSKSTASLSARSGLCDSVRSECFSDNNIAGTARDCNIGTSTNNNSCDPSLKVSNMLSTDISQPTVALCQSSCEPNRSCTNDNSVSKINLFVGLSEKRKRNSQRMGESIFRLTFR